MRNASQWVINNKLYLANNVLFSANAICRHIRIYGTYVCIHKDPS